MEPKTLQKAILYFAEPANCREYLVARRWPDGVICPKCGSKNVLFMAKYNRWHCREKHAAPQFTLKTGTIFEDSPIGLDKWLTAMWMVVNCKNGISSWEIHRTLGVTQKSAWFMLHRIRLSMQNAVSGKMGTNGGEVECDETFVGGKAKNMHPKSRAMFKAARESCGNALLVNKSAVMGVLDREQRQIRATVVPAVNRKNLQAAILKHLVPGAKVYTDEAALYRGLSKDYVHQFVNHMEKYVDGRVHCNGVENFWSLLKRGLNGTYIAVEPFHLFRYNNRATKENPLNDSDRFDLAVRQIVGKRIMYKELTGKELLSA